MQIREIHSLNSLTSNGSGNPGGTGTEEHPGGVSGGNGNNPGGTGNGEQTGNAGGGNSVIGSGITAEATVADNQDPAASVIQDVTSALDDTNIPAKADTLDEPQPLAMRRSVKTGDESNMVLWLTLMLISVCAFTSDYIYKRK